MLTDLKEPYVARATHESVRAAPAPRSIVSQRSHIKRLQEPSVTARRGAETARTARKDSINAKLTVPFNSDHDTANDADNSILDVSLFNDSSGNRTNRMSCGVKEY